LCGAGDLFLMGDLAQSVIEGVECHFEEIWSVVIWYLTSPSSQFTWTSKATVGFWMWQLLAILLCLFKAFPDSAKQLKEDHGLFQGPCSSVFHKVDVPWLAELACIKEKWHCSFDSWSKWCDQPARWSKALGDYPLVYGIHEEIGVPRSNLGWLLLWHPSFLATAFAWFIIGVRCIWYCLLVDQCTMHEDEGRKDVIDVL
jgi:hypothetical protein